MDWFRLSTRFLTLATLFVAIPSWADVALRVEARPIADPIQAFVTVTDPNTGDPVQGLTAASFSVFLDGAAVQTSGLTLPPSQDPDNQKVSVVFAMDYTSSVTDIALPALQTAVITFIDQMNVGDFAAILKFNNTTGAVVVQGFTEIDQGPNNQLLEDAVMAAYPGDGSNILDGANRAVQEFAAQLGTLPAGPKAVILVTDGIDTHSGSDIGDVIGNANGSGIPIFTVGVGSPNQDAIELMTTLAADTGGQFVPAPDDQSIADAYASISFLLTNEYLLTIDSAISDCAEHTLEVAVAGQPTTASSTFTRRDCDTTPDAFIFTSQTGVRPDTIVKSNSITVTGLEAPASVGITQGSYSIGCGDQSTFTSSGGTIEDGETICVRHTTSAEFSTTKVTTLNIGGVSDTFTTTTRAEGSGGGGGATGLLELLLGFGIFLVRRLRPA